MLLEMRYLTQIFSLHDGDCSSLALLIDVDGNDAANDDCCGYGPSTVSVYAYAGTTVTILWTNSWNPGPFTFYRNRICSSNRATKSYGNGWS